MTARTRQDESAAKSKRRYLVKTWAEYDRALVNCGNLTIWFGEGEWKVRQHGVGKRRTWCKIHLAVASSTARDIMGIEVTTADWHDSEVLPDLLAQLEGGIAQVSADGAYDTEGAHAAIAERGAKTAIPPRKGATFWGNDPPRDAMLAEIAAKGREAWKEESGYHRCSLAENVMYRLKQLGDRLFFCEFDRQVAESHVRAAIINSLSSLSVLGKFRLRCMNQNEERGGSCRKSLIYLLSI